MAAAGVGPLTGWLAFAIVIVSHIGLVTVAVAGVLDGTSFDDVVGHLALPAAFSVYVVVGALLLWRRPRLRIARLMCGVGVLIGVGGSAQEIAGLAITGRSAPLAGGLVAAWIANWFWYVLMTLVLVFVPLLFPTGRLVSRRWQPVLIVAVVAMSSVVVVGSVDPVFDGVSYKVANPLGIDAVGDVEDSPIGGLVLVTVFGCAVAALASLIIRLRHARGVERTQIKWVVYAYSLLVALVLVTDLVPVLASPSDVPFAAALAAVPVSVAIAVLKHGLYDIDRLISRTISYGVLTILLAATYLSVVVAMQEVMPVRGGLAVAASTLVVAALFNPLRRRVQMIVNRRFNRAAYDARNTVDAFARRMRTQINLSELADELQDVTVKTMQPRHVSLWVPGRHRPPSASVAEWRRP